MIPRLSTGWQTTIADIALILFIVSAAGLRADPGKAGDDRTEIMPASGQPLAIYSAANGAVPLAEWLAEQAPDARQQLSIVVQYRDGQQAAAASQAIELAEQAGAAGDHVRIIIERGEAEGPMVVLAYDKHV